MLHSRRFEFLGFDVSTAHGAPLALLGVLGLDSHIGVFLCCPRHESCALAYKPLLSETVLIEVLFGQPASRWRWSGKAIPDDLFNSAFFLCVTYPLCLLVLIPFFFPSGAGPEANF